MDVLGAKEIIRNNDEEQEKFLKLKKLLRRFYELGDKGKGTTEIEITTFSDHFVISCCLNDIPDGSIRFQDRLNHFFSVAIRLHLEGLNSGLLLRGAIVRGKLFHENDLIFGKALLDAEKNEREAAKYPRVVVENSILEKTCKHLKKNFLTSDKCGNFYIDYLNEDKFQSYGNDLNLTNVFEMIKTTMEKYKHANEKIFEKWEWMEQNYKP